MSVVLRQHVAPACFYLRTVYFGHKLCFRGFQKTCLRWISYRIPVLFLETILLQNTFLAVRLWRQADFCTARSPSPLRKFKSWSNWSRSTGLFQCLVESCLYSHVSALVSIELLFSNKHLLMIFFLSLHTVSR